MALELSNRKISCTWKIDHCILCSSIELFQVFFGSWHGPNTYMPTYCLFFQNKNYKMVNPLEKSVVATCPWLYTGHTMSKLSIRFNSMNQHFWVQNIKIHSNIIQGPKVLVNWIFNLILTSESVLYTRHLSSIVSQSLGMEYRAK